MDKTDMLVLWILQENLRPSLEQDGIATKYSTIPPPSTLEEEASYSYPVYRGHGQVRV